MTPIKTSLLCGAMAAALCAVAGGAQAQDLTTRWSGAPRFSNDDVYFKVRGRVLLDGVFQSVDREGNLQDFETRNIRGRQVFLGVEGALNSQFAYKVEGGAVNGGAWSWDDVVIEYKPTETTSVLFGNIKVVGLENLTSTRFTEFMDRGPYGDAVTESYLLGVVGKMSGPNWSITAGVQGNSINSADVNNAVGVGSEERSSIAVRGHFAPISTDTTKLHLGVWARGRDNGDEAAFGYGIRPNTNFGTTGGYLNTGAIADDDVTIAAEAAFIYKQFSVQAEYGNISYDRITGQPGGDGDIRGGYIFGTWNVTGEMRNYDQVRGEFGRPKVLNPVTGGGRGALTVAVRYDFFDASDARNTQALTQDSGEYNAWTVGVNYYPTSYVRFMANYTKADIDNPVLGRDYEIDQFQLRAQLDF